MEPFPVRLCGYERVIMNELDEARKKIDADQYSEMLAAGLLEQIKYSKSLEEVNKKLRLELHTLRFKEAEDQRFIWWIWNVYAKNVNDLILSIISATTYDNETMAKLGKYGLPMKCFEFLERVKEGTDIIYGSDRIYDGTYLNVEISADVKKGIPENKPEPSLSDVSVTQDVLIDIKTPQSVEIEELETVVEHLQIRLSEWRGVARQLADELKEEISSNCTVIWEEAGETSPAWIAYNNLVDTEDYETNPDYYKGV